MGMKVTWKKEADAETSEFLDDVLAYFQEDEVRMNDFEQWQFVRSGKEKMGWTDKK